MTGSTLQSKWHEHSRVGTSTVGSHALPALQHD